PDVRVADVADVLDDLKANVARIEEHGRRADSIVRSMLAHSRGGRGTHERVNLNRLVDEYVSLAYHGARAQRPGLNATIERDLDPASPTVEAVPEDLGRVLLNLVSNSLYAVHGHFSGEVAPEGYAPTLRVSTKAAGDHVEIRVWDNGGGIPEAVRARIFEPFFTTKPTGEGTGLGLSLSHDIVAAHGGTLSVVTGEIEGTTEFIVRLPRSTPISTPEPAV
ncbi:MAG TPA: HAMP domain-containing sensor histidine kinase, partial [Rhodothermales bacterium]|nr:HAMP domain-containing sensor histidine kinase [Rhodothermales bacterium]